MDPNLPSPQPAAAPRRRRWTRNLPELVFLVLVVVGRASFADHYYVPSGSMEPTLAVGDRLVVDKRAYGLRVPLTQAWLTRAPAARGDVVVFASPLDGTVTVKRVVAVPGDRVAFHDGRLWLGGAPVDVTAAPPALREALPGAPHFLHPEADQGPDLPEQVVPEGHYLVMGDHRGNSFDGRSWGFLPHAQLLGRATHVVYTPREGLSGAERWLLPLSAPDPRLAVPGGAREPSP